MPLVARKPASFKVLSSHPEPAVFKKPTGQHEGAAGHRAGERVDNCESSRASKRLAPAAGYDRNGGLLEKRAPQSVANETSNGAAEEAKPMLMNRACRGVGSEGIGQSFER